uniref:Uncharacterized protein n=1 Tax=Globisporangium ultimum (strain ATCC 200006 / CBS 805.95 / DAOM BR144) TaxID=431595 RepID=K3WWT4_GLOUD
MMPIAIASRRTATSDCIIENTSPPFVPKPIVKSTDTENEKPSKYEWIAVLQLLGTVR